MNYNRGNDRVTSVSAVIKKNLQRCGIRTTFGDVLIGK